MTAGAVAVASDPRQEIQQRMDALRRSGAGQTMAIYFQEQLDQRVKALMSCTRDTFEVHKGRCIELENIIKYLTS